MRDLLVISSRSPVISHPRHRAAPACVISRDLLAISRDLRPLETRRRSAFGEGPLHHAAWFGEAQAVRRLLDAADHAEIAADRAEIAADRAEIVGDRAEIDAVGMLGESALHCAAQQGCVKVSLSSVLVGP